MVRGRKNIKTRRSKVRQNSKNPKRSAIQHVEAKKFGWNSKRTLRGNYAALGLASTPNDPLVQRKNGILEKMNIHEILNEQRKRKEEEKSTANSQAESSEPKLADEWKDLDSDRALSGYRLTAERRPDHWMSDEEMRYMKPLIAKYRDDYTKMFRDIKLNSLQKTRTWIENKAIQYSLFTANQTAKA
mmetsp:Transcript_25521/g.31367  ORF Transcript_25521/g.31367 Transcript_25521/m.31367 type:complete len:187 (+) Transcript_25521:88-648(+)